MHFVKQLPFVSELLHCYPRVLESILALDLVSLWAFTLVSLEIWLRAHFSHIQSDLTLPWKESGDLQASRNGVWLTGLHTHVF